MPIRLITPTLVASAKPRKKRYEIHDRDLTGFYLIVWPFGVENLIACGPTATARFFLNNR